MTKISFYVLPEGDDALPFACRVTEKAFRLGQAVYLHCPDASRAQTLDDMLWTFRQGSFIPHTRALDDADTPVLIGNAEPPAHCEGLMINLGEEIPLFFSRFERVAEFVTSATKQSARGRYKFYQDRGYELETHKIEPAA